MELNHLKTFLAVAESESFSLAADTLHLTQPAISKRISALENSLDTKLFDRIGREVHLTEAGKLLLPAASNICGDMKQVQQAISNLGRTVSGKLSVGTSHHIGLHRLPQVLRKFTARYPDVELDLHFMDSEDACTKVEQNSLELAIVTLPETPFAQVNSELIWNDPMLVCCPTDHPLTKLKAVNPRDLARFPAIVPSPETVTRQVLDSALLPFQVRVHIALETNYIETIKMMVSVGLGWGVIPEIMVSDDLEIIDVEGFTLSRKLGITTHKKRSLSSAARAFVDVLREDDS